MVLEMDLRFGGGYPFSYVAGVSIPVAFLAWGRGEEASWERLIIDLGVVLAKCDRMVVREADDH